MHILKSFKLSKKNAFCPPNSFLEKKSIHSFIIFFKENFGQMQNIESIIYTLEAVKSFIFIKFTAAVQLSGRACVSIRQSDIYTGSQVQSLAPLQFFMTCKVFPIFCLEIMIYKTFAKVNFHGLLGENECIILYITEWNLEYIYTSYLSL